MYEDEYDNEELLSGGKYETERLKQALAAERSVELELQMEPQRTVCCSRIR